MTISDFSKKKKAGEAVSMVTAYDSWSASLIENTSVDCILVGDSVAMTMHGHSSTIPIDIQTMVLHVEAVRRGAPEAFIVGDMPFLTCRMGLNVAMENVSILMKAGANAVKVERAGSNLPIIRHIVESGVPVMGHLGLTPQSVNSMSGFRVQGRTSKARETMKQDALNLEESGCFAMVLEAIPSNLAQEITQSLQISTIGIGAGAETDGQVLVLHDLLGLSENFNPVFVRRFMEGSRLIKEALEEYHSAVVSGVFPSEKEQYSQ